MSSALAPLSVALLTIALSALAVLTWTGWRAPRSRPASVAHAADIGSCLTAIALIADALPLLLTERSTQATSKALSMPGTITLPGAEILPATELLGTCWATLACLGILACAGVALRSGDAPPGWRRDRGRMGVSVSLMAVLLGIAAFTGS